MNKKREDKPLRWVGSSKDDISAFPDSVKERLGFNLRQVQRGLTPETSKPLKGLDGVYELKQNDESGTYRAAYIAKLFGAIYVLHCFQKKSKQGIATPQKEIELIKARLKQAIEDSHRQKEKDGKR